MADAAAADAIWRFAAFATLIYADADFSFRAIIFRHADAAADAALNASDTPPLTPYHRAIAICRHY